MCLLGQTAVSPVLGNEPPKFRVACSPPPIPRLQQSTTRAKGVGSARRLRTVLSSSEASYPQSHCRAAAACRLWPAVMPLVGSPRGPFGLRRQGYGVSPCAQGADPREALQHNYCRGSSKLQPNRSGNDEASGSSDRSTSFYRTRR